VSTVLCSAELWSLLKHKRKSCKQQITIFSNGYWAALGKTKVEMKKSGSRQRCVNWNLLARKEDWDGLGTSRKWMIVDCQNKLYI